MFVNIMLASILIIFIHPFASSDRISTKVSSFDSIVLLPNDEKVHYMGRFDFTEPLTPIFSWVMTGIKISFSNSASIFGNFTAPADHARLRVVIDNETHGFVSINHKTGSMKSYELAAGLSLESHILEVFKVSEDNTQKGSKGTMKFGGFELRDEGSFGPRPPSLPHKLEFIGDSDTAGWCADGSSKTGDDPNKYEDAYETWAQQIARLVGAETMVEAVSGWGVTEKSSPIQNILNNINEFDNKVKWNYTSWTPDAIVILIGPNDEITKDNSKKFIAAYLDLMNIVAKNYASATSVPKIIHVCGGSINGLDPCDDIQKANDQFNQQKNIKIKGFYTSITTANWKKINAKSGRSEYNGCDEHYNKQGHAVLAGDILPQLKKILKW